MHEVEAHGHRKVLHDLFRTVEVEVGEVKGRCPICHSL